MQTCPACGQVNPDGFRLCGMCGAALTAAPGPAREERKVVTILFTDLVGFTSAAERLDPEDVRATLAPYYARLRAELERHGGTVEKFIGDAVMAVFGAPVAHEDDPERAVRAALAIRDAVAGDLQIRTAVNTGEALVALGARPTEGEGMVSGDVVNTAARLQSAAPVNGILAGEATYRATRDAIEYRDAPPVEAKGKAEPVRAWEVVAARSRFGSDVEERLRTPLVGRERERALLGEALARVRSEQSAQLVTLVGVPGIGKSRLVAELFQIVQGDPDLIFWRQGRSLPYGESVSFWALGEIVKAQAGILESDDVGGAQAKLDEMLESLFADESERAWVAQHTRRLVGLESETQVDRAEAFSAWRRLLEAAAERRPLVLVFEDLHWADDGLLDFVDHLADWATTVPLLLLGTARPELLDRRPGWGGGKRNAITLSIGALSDDDTALLLAHLFERAVLPADVQATLLQRAAGNPLYAEEYVRMLQEHEGAELPLPESVQGLIAARIDALPPGEKALLQDAAVIGKVFWPGAVGGPDEQLLHSLVRKEFIRRDRRSSVAGETQFAFLHALVRDVAYGQIPRAARIQRHRAAAEWIGRLAGDRSEDRAEMLAHHYREALALAASAHVDVSDLRGPAKQAFAEASERAQALHAWHAARDLAREGLALAEEDEALRPNLQLRYVEAAQHLDQWEGELALEARDAFLALGDVEGAARAEILIGDLGFWTGDPTSRRHFERALELLDERPPSPLQARAIARFARRLSIRGEIEEAMRLAQRALDLAGRFGDERIASDALNTRGMCRCNDADAEGLADVREAIARGEAVNAAFETSIGLNNLMNLLRKFGRLDEAVATGATLRDVNRRYGLTTGDRWNDAETVYEELLQGDLVAALRDADSVLDHAPDAGRYADIGMHGARGFLLATRGSLDRALPESTAALELATALGDIEPLLHATTLHAFVLFAAGRPDESLANLRRALDDASFTSWPEVTTVVPLLLVEVARPDLYPDTRDRPFVWHDAAHAAATGDLAAAAEIYGRIGARFNEAWARLLAAERGDAAQLDAALGYFAREQATVFIRRCEALLPASA